MTLFPEQKFHRLAHHWSAAFRSRFCTARAFATGLHSLLRRFYTSGQRVKRVYDEVGTLDKSTLSIPVGFDHDPQARARWCVSDVVLVPLTPWCFYKLYHGVIVCSASGVLRAVHRTDGAHAKHINPRGIRGHSR